MATTLYKWSDCGIWNTHESDEDDRRYLEEFEMESKPGVTFVLFFNWNEYYGGVVLKKNPTGERIKVDIQFWVESWNDIESNVLEMRDQTFQKVNDECEMELRGNVDTLISRAGEEGSFIKFFCKLTDKSDVTTTPTFDWYNDYHKNLWAAYKQGIGTDTTIQLDSGKEFKITGALLMAQSPVFQAMFKTDYDEGQSKTVVIKDIEDDVMEAFIKWMYIGEAHLTKLSQELFVIADRYQVSSLKEQCLHYMINDIYSENVIQYLIFGFEYNNEDLKKAAIQIIQKMPNSEVVEIFASNEWKQFAAKHKSDVQDVNKLIEEKTKEPQK